MAFEYFDNNLHKEIVRRRGNYDGVQKESEE